MTTYTDIFVVPVPKKNTAAYRKDAELFLNVWREHGALSCIEVEGDDVPVGKVTSFPRSVALKDDEAVFVGIMTFRSRAHRDEVNAKAMKDPRMAGMNPKSMPFDAKRMFFGGFKSFVGQAAASTVQLAQPTSRAEPVTAIQPYLLFNGRCEDAITFYKKALGAEVQMLLRFKDNPDKPGPDKVPPGLDNKIMHACLKIGAAEIMLSDGMSTGDPQFKGVTLALSAATQADAKRLFKQLGNGGKVLMPLTKTFFSSSFGMVADKFGVEWMVNVPAPK